MPAAQIGRAFTCYLVDCGNGPAPLPGNLDHQPENDMNPLKTFIAVIASVMLVGCAPKEIALSNLFDADAAQELLQKGNNTIRGSALIRQRGGGVVSCAGYEVVLIPVTAHASERMSAIYGSTNRGYRNFSPLTDIKFAPDPPAYHNFNKRSACDAQGNFVFKDVADGDFYVTLSITWEVPSQSLYSFASSSTQGGDLMQRVTVSGGETKEIVLSPH